MKRDRRVSKSGEFRKGYRAKRGRLGGMREAIW